MKTLLQGELRNASQPAKVMVIGFLLSLGLAYLYALANIAMVVGWTPRDIAIHYYGAEQVIRSENVQSGEQSLDLEALDAAPVKNELGPRPSFKSLVQEGHFHLFGMTTFFFLLTFLALFTRVPSTWKCWLVGVPYACVVLDNLSFMATRFLGPRFAYLTAVSGGLMGLSFTVLWVVVMYEVLQKGEIAK